MTFFTIVLRSLTRRPVRTCLTLVGISIGIAAVVTLVGMAWGYEKGIGKQLDVVGVDVVVSNMSGGLMPKMFDESLEQKVAALPRVKETTTVLMQMLSVEDAPIMMISGRKWGGFTWDKMKVIDGRLPKDGDEKVVVLGTLAAEVLKKKVGDTVQIEAEELAVVGIVDGQAMVENGTIFLSLTVMQEVTGNPGKINFLDIRVPPNTPKSEIDLLCQDVKVIFPEGRAMVASEVVGTSQGFRVARAMSWSTSLLAIIVGVLGVMSLDWKSGFGAARTNVGRRASRMNFMQSANIRTGSVKVIKPDLVFIHVLIVKAVPSTIAVTYAKSIPNSPLDRHLSHRRGFGRLLRLSQGGNH